MFFRRCSLWLFASLMAAGCAGAPATIEYVETVPAKPRIGEIATVKFKLTDFRGVPQAGSVVLFSIQGAQSGVTLTPTMAMSQKGSGEVTTQVISTGAAQSVVVLANAGGGKTATSPPITFSGSAAAANQFTFQCGSIAGKGSGGVHAIGAYDQLRSLIAGVKLNCTAHVADRNGDGVPGVLVSFLTEAGAINPTETTMSDGVGNATVLYKTSLPLPKDVEPKAFNWNPDGTCAASDKKRDCNGEYLVPLWMEPNSWTSDPVSTLLKGSPAYNPEQLAEPRRKDPIRRTPTGSNITNNPRDNLVSLIAWTVGEESFTDANQNGKYDEGELFEDIVEPFVDSNDNATWDQDERYVDSNGNGKWDGRNEKWDQNTYIWRQERILWTGIPFGALFGRGAGGTMQVDDTTDSDADGLHPSIKGATPLSPPPMGNLVSCSGPPGPVASFSLIVSDPWFNSLAQNAEDDGCEKQDSSKNVEVTGVDRGFAFTYPPARKYTFAVIDNLQRNPSPMTNPPSPGCFPPPPAANGSSRQKWTAAVKCSYTAAREEGHKAVLYDITAGDIDNNLPNVP